MRVAVDATPLLGHTTGVGRYVAQLLPALAALPDAPELVLTAFSRSGGQPPVHGATWAPRRLPARLLQQTWRHTNLPPAEWLTGSTDVFHATNFVLPPTRRAAGLVTIHDLTFDRYPSLVTPAVARYQHLVPRSLAMAQIVLVCSQAVAVEVRDRYPTAAEKIRVAPLGVDPDWFQAAPPSSDWLSARDIPSDYLLAVGTLEPRKNLRRLVAAHRSLRATDPECPLLVIVGPPGWGEPLQADPEHVVLTGWLEDDQLRALTAGARVLAYPSLYEGFGLPPLEAFACGTAVACSDLPALREVLGTLPEYANPEDIGDIAEALARALASPAATGEVRRQHARRWTWQACATKTREAYDEALALSR